MALPGHQQDGADRPVDVACVLVGGGLRHILREQRAPRATQAHVSQESRLPAL